ncbi:I78 family peptidase inhibitor [Comamonas sp. GB3 AK4-5]|uniref:I78 family peptidase inhibitor n=1 Tax=Comamonas sp. GB3 AK4-5 TaxID=3231487 RepID=UPI00351F35C4
MRTALWTWMAITTVLAGCASGPRPKPAAPAPLQRCNAAAAQWAVGKTNTSQHVDEARRRSGALMARVLRADQPGNPAVPQVVDVERLNLQVDATGRIIAATCG